MLFLIGIICVFTEGYSEIQLFTKDSSMTGQTRQPPQGEPLTLHCVLSSTGITGAVTVTDWTKDSASVSTLRQTLPFNTSADTLSILQYSTEYDGYYQCIARLESNNTLILQASPPILLTSYSTRRFNEHPVKHTIRISTSKTAATASYMYEALTFSCTLSKTFRGPKPIITWQVIEPNGIVNNYTDFNDDSGRDIIIQYDHTGYYQRHDPSMADSGLRVRCVASNSESLNEIIYSNWATMDIGLLSPEINFNPFTMTPPSTYYIDANQAIIRLPCSVRNIAEHTPQGRNHSIVIRWYRGSAELFSGNDSQVTIDGVSCFGWTNLQLDLRILTPEYLQEKEFSCQVTVQDSGQQYKASTMISVHAPVIKPPPVTIHTFTIEAAENGGVNQSIFISPPLLNTTYLITRRLWVNGRVVSDNGHKCFIETLGKTGETIVSIRNQVSVADSGQYQLEFITGTILDYSVHVYTFELIVKVDVIIFQQLCGYSREILPPNLTPELACSPTPLPSSVSLYPSTGYIEVDSDIAVTHSRNYTCFGHTLKFVLEIDIIVFTSVIEHIIAKIGSTTTLHCTNPLLSSSIVSRYIWRKNGVIVQEDSFNDTLVIDSVSSISLGQYECTTVLNTGCSLQAMTIQIGVEQRRNDLLRTFRKAKRSSISGAYVVNATQDLIVLEGASVTLQCMAEGIPNDNIMYTWKKNGITLTTTNTGTYTISSVKASDIAQYECVPFNTHGTLNTSVTQLDVKVERSLDILDEVRGETERLRIFEVGFISDPFTCTPSIPGNGRILVGILFIAGSPSAIGTTYSCTSPGLNGTLLIEFLKLAAPYVVDSIDNPVVANRGTDIVLWCKAEAFPDISNANCIWEKNGVFIDLYLPEDNFNCTLTIQDMSFDDIGEYNCVPEVNLDTTHNTSLISLNIRVSVKLNSLYANEVTDVVMATTDAYSCIPALPDNVVLHNSGTLTSQPGVTESVTGEYNCSTASIDGNILIDLTVDIPKVGSLTIDNNDGIRSPSLYEQYCCVESNRGKTFVNRVSDKQNNYIFCPLDTPTSCFNVYPSK